MADQSPITANELAEEAGLSLQCLKLAFREEHAHILAEFCDPWEEIGYHLKLTKANIGSIKDDNATTEKRRIATLQKWKQKFAHKATYRVLIEAIIQSEQAEQALKLLKKIKHEIRPASESDGVSIEPRDPSLLNTTGPTSPVDHDTSSEEFVPSVDISHSIYSLQMRFIRVQNRFLQSSAGTGVTLEQLQTCVSTLPSFTTDTPQVLLEASSIPTFAHNLKQYCCALDPDILEGLIEVLGDVETKTMMNTYSRDLHNFQCRTKLKDFIGIYEGPTPPEYKEVEIKLGDGWQEKTLADVKMMKSQISRRIWLMKMVLIGSVCVTFMVPQAENLELDVHLRDYLQSLCVLQIFVCGVCIFKYEGKKMTTCLNGSQEEMITEEESKKGSQISLDMDEVAVQEVRDYFIQMTCNLRVLGSQLGLEPYELDEIEYHATSLSDQKQRLVDKCAKQEKLISWEHLAATLEKPALNMYRMASEIRAKHVYSRQYSLESCSSINSPMSTRMDSLSSQEASISSSMEIDQKFTIPEAVNLIIMVDGGSLRELGRKLGVDEARLTRLFSYDASERHQRLIEAWFEQATHEISRNTLLEALPRRGSSISMSSLPPTPTFKPSSDIELQIRDFEIRFSELQADTEEELKKRHKTVETVSARLRALPPRLSKDSDMAYVKKLSSYNKDKPRTLEELFVQLNTCCWNCFEYELLEFIIKSNRCSKALENRMDEYAKDMKRFKDTTTISMFIKHGKQFLKVKKPPEDHKVVKTKQRINPEKNTLSYLDLIREDVWTTMKLSECIPHFHNWSLNTGCVEIEWLIPEEYDYDLIMCFCAESGKNLMERHQIESICINAVLIDNSLLLLTAAYYEIWEKVDSLLTADIDLNASKHMTGETALFFVAANGKEDLVRKMLNLRADPNVKNHDGKSPLMFAAEHGHEMVILLLLDCGANIDFKQESTGQTALFFAAENGHDAATSILLAYGADSNLQDVGGETPYVLAKKKDHEKVCQELLPPEMKKQPEARSYSLRHRFEETIHSLTQGFRVAFFGNSLIEAAKNGDLKTVEYILRKEEDPTTNIDAGESDEHGWTALIWASDRGNDKIVQLLLDKGANVNKASKSRGWSPLMIASRKGHLKVVKILFEHGANIDHQNNSGLSSLAISIYERHTAVAIFLIHKGANIHITEKDGWNPLMRASTEGNLKLVKIIADRGGRLNDVLKEYNWTSVMLAAKYGHEEVVKELVKRGADLTITTREGETALHIATLRRQPGVIKQLAITEQSNHKRPDLDILSRDGLTALMAATNKGYEKEIDALLEGGAQVNITHKETGWTAIFFAAKNGYVEIVQNLLHHGAKTELDDGTRLIDVANHLNQMSIIHALGTDVDAKLVPHEEPQNVDRAMRTLEAIFSRLEETVKTWAKVA